LAFKDSRKKFNSVFFSPWSEDATDSWSAFIQFPLHVCVGEFEARWTAIDDNAHTSAVAFTKAGYYEVSP
jgi:hypothetical protein